MPVDALISAASDVRLQAQNGLDILHMKLDLEEKNIAAAFQKLLSSKPTKVHLHVMCHKLASQFLQACLQA